jgi:hypothetical protein
MVGNVYIASMNLRGNRAIAPLNCTVINATSAQSKTNKNRRDFSPMTHIEGGYKGFWNFESYWQSGKVLENIPHNVTKKWWQKLTKPKRRYPNSKGIKVLYSRFDGIDQNLDYVDSRKKVYVPEYYDLIKNREMTKYWRNKVKHGMDIVIYDFDGPRTQGGDVQCLPVTKALLNNKINDLTFPFGHGYVVAATIMGIKPIEYTQ